jgi:hypothetical protein
VELEAQVAEKMGRLHLAQELNSTLHDNLEAVHAK